jgi:hypothetical protein
MKSITKIFVILGVAFWSIGLLYSVSKLIALNGLGNIFEMNEAQNAKTRIIKDSTHITISYKYQVEEKTYQDSYKMLIEYFERCDVDTIAIKYNKRFPMVSYIDCVPLKIRQQKVGMIISAFFILFFIVLWKLSDKDKWLKHIKKNKNENQ